MSEVKSIERDKAIFNARELGCSWSQIARDYDVSVNSARLACGRAIKARKYQVFLRDALTQEFPVLSVTVTGGFIEAVAIAFKRQAFLQALTLPSWEFISDTGETIKITKAWSFINAKQKN